MTHARRLISAGATACVALVLAGCMTGGGPSDPPCAAAATGVEGAWIDAQGTGLSTFSGGIFQTVATDTGQKLAEGSYFLSTATSVQIYRHVADPPAADQLQLPADLDEPAQLHHRPAARTSC